MALRRAGGNAGKCRGQYSCLGFNFELNLADGPGAAHALMPWDGRIALL